MCSCCFRGPKCLARSIICFPTRLWSGWHVPAQSNGLPPSRGRIKHIGSAQGHAYLPVSHSRQLTTYHLLLFLLRFRLLRWRTNLSNIKLLQLFKVRPRYHTHAANVLFHLSVRFIPTPHHHINESICQLTVYTSTKITKSGFFRSTVCHGPTISAIVLMT